MSWRTLRADASSRSHSSSEPSQQIVGLKIECLPTSRCPSRAGSATTASSSSPHGHAAPLDGKTKPVDVQFIGVQATSESKGKQVSASCQCQPKDGWAADEDTHHDEPAAFRLTSPVGFRRRTRVAPSPCTLTAGCRSPVCAVSDHRGLAGPHLKPTPPRKAAKEVAARSPGRGRDHPREPPLPIARWLRTVDPEAKLALGAGQGASGPRAAPAAGSFVPGHRGRPVYYLGRGEVNKKNGCGFHRLCRNA